MKTFEPQGEIETNAQVTDLKCDDEMIYVGTEDNYYSAYDANTKEMLWRFKIPYSLEDFFPGIVYSEDTTFLDWNSKNLFCFDTRKSVSERKRILWRFQIDSVCPEAEISWPSTWHIEKDKIYLKLYNCRKYSYIILDNNTGKFLKGIKLPWESQLGSRVIVSNSTIYCVTADGVFYCQCKLKMSGFLQI